MAIMPIIKGELVMKHQTISNDNFSILTVVIKTVRVALGYQTKIILGKNAKILKAVWEDKAHAYKYGQDIVSEFKENIFS